MDEENIEEKITDQDEEAEELSALSDDSIVAKTVSKTDANGQGSLDDKSITEAIFEEGVGNLKPRELTVELETSYLDYAMSVIVSRALPDVRDGMKPVHRRVIYAMHETGLTHSAKYRKCAAVVGEVLKSYHPHGDMAVYDSLVRMAQDFSMRYMLVDGQGNFGSMDGDSAAAMRYTESRMTSLAEEMVADIDKETVDWQDNYDGSTKEPKVLPARVPQLLLNGAMGIAVGMATNIPPHNLKELCDGIIHLINNPETTIEEMMEFVKGPDFPTGGYIYNFEDIKAAYVTGKGRIVMRAKAEIEETKRGHRVIISEIPYQVNKASMIEKIADLVKNKKIEGISDLRDESDRHGVRVVVELKANSYPEKVLNRLYELTPMQTAFHVNMLALTPDLEPRVMTLKDICQFYIKHRQEIIERRTKFDLRKAQERAHILEGLKIALDHIDEVISTIRASANRPEAHDNLIKKFAFSSIQANAILDMRLSSLAALERKRLEEEYEQVLQTIAYLEDLLAHPEKILGLIRDDLAEISKKYGDERRTTVIPHALGEFRAEDLIPDEQVIVSLSHGNYVKRQDVNTYRKQVRGGVGVTGMTTKAEDAVEHLCCANTHDDIYFFSDKGRVFKSKVYDLPATSRLSKGTPVVNVIQISSDEKVTALLTVPKVSDNHLYFVMGTVLGQIKKTEVKQYDNIRKTGIVAMGLKGNDKLKWVKTSTGNDSVIEVSEHGQAICFPEEEVRPMGRSASGVTGMRLKGKDSVMAMDIVPEKYFSSETERGMSGADMLVVLENGFGKRTPLNHFHLQKRGGYGMRAANCTERTGKLIGMHITYSNEGDVVLASQNGQFIRMALANIKKLGRDTQGVTLMKLRLGDKVSSVAIVLSSGQDEADGNNGDDAIKGPDGQNGPAIEIPVPVQKIKVPGPKPQGVKKESTRIAKDSSVENKTPAENISAGIAGDQKFVSHLPISIKSYDERVKLNEQSSSVNSPDKKDSFGESKPSSPAQTKDSVNYWGRHT